MAENVAVVVTGTAVSNWVLIVISTSTHVLDRCWKRSAS